MIMDRKPEPTPESEQAADRVSEALEHEIPAEDLDPADVERVNNAMASPQPDLDEREDT